MGEHQIDAPAALIPRIAEQRLDPLPHKARARGRLVRIALDDFIPLPLRIIAAGTDLVVDRFLTLHIGRIARIDRGAERLLLYYGSFLICRWNILRGLPGRMVSPRRLPGEGADERKERCLCAGLRIGRYRLPPRVLICLLSCHGMPSPTPRTRVSRRVMLNLNLPV